jgi:small-conductance mechanosensitive channel
VVAVVTAGSPHLLQTVAERLDDLLGSLGVDLRLVFERALAILAILVLAWVARRLLRVLTNRLRHIADDADPTTLSAAEQRAHTLAGIAHSIGTVLISLGVGLMVLDLFIAIGPLLAGVGVAGLAVSFGAQSLVKDVISGFFVLLENQFAVGDVIAIDGTSGKVERMTLRVVMLRDLSGVLHIIPNGSIAKVSNMTRALPHGGGRGRGLRGPDRLGAGRPARSGAGVRGRPRVELRLQRAAAGAGRGGAGRERGDRAGRARHHRRPPMGGGP